ncbi:MAG: hypothetical protein WCE65_09175 [Methanoregula sp.]
MTGRWGLLIGFVLILFIVTAGCTSVSVGTISYGNDNLTVAVAGPGTPQTIYVQVRVFTLDQFAQQDLLTTGITANLTGSDTNVSIPMHLDPGRYKMYVYIFQNGERETAVIRDITV